VDVAFVVYDGMTTMDFLGVYDAVTRLRSMGFMPGLRWDVCGVLRDVREEKGLRVGVDRVCGPFDAYDLVVLPGGVAALKLVEDADFIGWIRTAEGCPVRASVCTGSLLWGAAGLLQDRTATTHRNALKLLERYCPRVVDRRIVDDGDVITARGVTSSLDLGLYLCEKLAGREARERIARQMDYPYFPEELALASPAPAVTPPGQGVI